MIVRSGQALKFADAAAITVNSRDKALSLGDKPAIGGAVSKLPAVPLAGILLKDSDSGALLEYQSGKIEYLLPQALPNDAPDNPAGIWKTARIAYKQAANDKTGTDIEISDFVAFLPDGIDQLAALCMDSRALQSIGGTGKNLPAQVELMSAAVKAYAASPAIAAMQKSVEDAMRTRYDAFENGAGNVAALDEGLQFCSLSQAVYPDSPEQANLCKLLTDRKAWLDRKIAIQKAFAAAGRWDSFLLGERGLEAYRQSFPEMVQDHNLALLGSMRIHSQAAATLEKEGDYEAAYREFRLAGTRKPSDPAVHEQATQAWTEYSRRNAMDLQTRRNKLSAGPQSAVERDLFFAEQNKLAKKLDEALKNVQDAEAVLHASQPAGAVSSTDLKVWYAEAEILGAQDRINQALTVLDTYDLHAVDEERAQGDKLRNRLLFDFANSLKSLKSKVQAAWSDGNFSAVQQLSAEGLRMDANDADLLYYSGVSSLARRDAKQGHDLLIRYLDASNTLDANEEQRAQVSRLLARTLTPSGDAPGEANWLSGDKIPKPAFYSPLSLAFGPHIDRIDASGRFHVTFDWTGERLKSVTPAFEREGNATGELKIRFVYEDRVPQVVWAADSDEAHPPSATDPDEAYTHATVLLPNNPLVDPLTIERITGKNPTLVIAGNRFFNPFVWEKLYYFRLTYDDKGRAIHAQEMSGPKGTPREQTLDFEWSGPQLTAIRGFAGKIKNYERTLQYQDGLLVGEEIQGQGKPSHIKYNYAGDRLVSADATADATLDNRSRKVTFLQNSASTLVK